MDRKHTHFLQTIVQLGRNLEEAATKLAKCFPGVASPLAWKEATFEEQRNFSKESHGPELQLNIALDWMALAKKHRLKVEMDPVHGLIVRALAPDEIGPKSPSSSTNPAMMVRVRKVLFNSLKDRAREENLLDHQLQIEFRRAVGESLNDHLDELNAVLRELSSKDYIVHRQHRGGAVNVFSQGIDFDHWRDEMTVHKQSTGGNNFHFHDAVGAVQTGDHAVANVQQVIQSGHADALRAALAKVITELSDSRVQGGDHEDARILVQSTLNEVDKPSPSALMLKSLVSGMSSVAKLLNTTSDAYQALKGAVLPFGVHLP